MGRKKSSDGDEIKPTLVTNLALNTTEVEKYRKVTDKVQLFQDKGPRMSALLSQLKGTSSILKLHKLPETDGSGNPSGGGQVGKLVHLHAEPARSSAHGCARSRHQLYKASISSATG